MSYTIFSMLLAATLAGSGSSNGNAQTVLDKAERDELFYVSKDDPHMAAAMRKARTTLPEFLAVARAAKPPTEGFSVKVAVREGSNAEYFWIVPFEEKNGRFAGKTGDRVHRRRDRRLDVFRQRQDEGKLHRLCAAAARAETASRGIQAALRARVRRLT